MQLLKSSTHLNNCRQHSDSSIHEELKSLQLIWALPEKALWRPEEAQKSGKPAGPPTPLQAGGSHGSCLTGIPIGLASFETVPMEGKSIGLHPSWPTHCLERVLHRCLRALAFWKHPPFLIRGVPMGGIQTSLLVHKLPGVVGSILGSELVSFRYFCTIMSLSGQTT